MELAQFVTIFCSLVAGVIGAAGFNWGLYRSYRNLESRVYDLEDRIISEIKKRASFVGRDKIQKEHDLEEWAQKQASVDHTPPATPTLKPLMEWRKEKMAGK